MVDVSFAKAGRSSPPSPGPCARLVLLEESGEHGKLLRVLPTGRLSFSVGLGPRKGLDAETVRRAAGKAVTYARAALGKGSLRLSGDTARAVLSDRRLVAAFVEGAILASYSFVKYKTSSDGASGGGNGNGKDQVFLKTVHLPVPSSPEIVTAKAVAEGTNWAREIQNEPANVATPTMLSLVAAREAKVLGLSYKAYSRQELEKIGFGAMLAVAKGSAEEPKLIVLEYVPKSGIAKRKVAIVGKGVCFDSGGISIKPAKAMDEMKFDKNGGVAALAIVRLAALLKLPMHIVAIVPAVENMPSGTATRPGDIVKSYSGKTIEILNTDAEGRLILSDALAFACKDHKPDVVIDLATLTGACVVALGDVAAGLFSNDEALAKDLYRAGLESGERLWELPLGWPDYAEGIKSDVADISNASWTRDEDAILAAEFLRTAVSGGARWAHLDIAGMDAAPKGGAYLSAGASGFGVRLLARYLSGKD